MLDRTLRMFYISVCLLHSLCGAAVLKRSPKLLTPALKRLPQPRPLPWDAVCYLSVWGLGSILHVNTYGAKVWPQEPAWKFPDPQVVTVSNSSLGLRAESAWWWVA